LIDEDVDLLKRDECDILTHGSIGMIEYSLSNGWAPLSVVLHFPIVFLENL
jgi:hypothetical protein